MMGSTDTNPLLIEPRMMRLKIRFKWLSNKFVYKKCVYKSAINLNKLIVSKLIHVDNYIEVKKIHQY